MLAYMLSLILLGAFLLLEGIKLILKRHAFSNFVHKNNSFYPRAVTRTLRLPFGIDHKLRMLSKKPEDLFGDYYFRKYEVSGPTHGIYDSFGSLKAVHTIDPENLKTVLSTSFGDWTVSQTRRNVLHPLAQGGVLTTEGTEWLHNRKFFQRHLNTAKSRDLRCLEPEMRLLFRAAGPGGEEGWSLREVDMSALLRRLTLDISTKYLFGISAESQKAGMRELDPLVPLGPKEPESELQIAMAKYTDALQLIRTYVTARGAMGSGYWMIDSPKYRRACTYLQDFAELLISKGSENTEGAALMNQMYDELRDPVQVRDNLLELVLGGQNMTSSILEWALAELALRPALYARLREEILERFGPEKNFEVASSAQSDGSDCQVEMTWDRLKTCPTLQNVLNETLRCYPTLANIGKTAAKDAILPRGGGHDGSAPVAVPKGTTFTCNVFLMHRRKETWGEDAWEWNPDRWIGRKLGPDFAPFGAGPRICVGRQLSLTQMSFIIARFVQHFDAIKPPVDANNLAMQYRPVLSPKKVRLFLKTSSAAGANSTSLAS